MFKNAFWAVPDSPSILANTFPATIVLIIKLLAIRKGLSGLALFRWSRKWDLFVFLHKAILVITVCLNICVVLLVELANLLSYGVQTSCCEGVHLLGSNLLLIHRFVDKRFEVGDCFDV